MHQNATPCNTSSNLPLPQHSALSNHYAAPPPSQIPHVNPPHLAPPTPRKPLYEGTPILANQESPEVPFHCDSQLANPPIDIPPLNSQQISAIDLISIGRTDTQIANTLGIHRSTLWRWRQHHPLFKSELSRRRHEVWGAAADRFRRHLFLALDTLRSHLKNENAIVQFRAAKALVNLAAHNRFAPPDQPTDPLHYLNEHALARRREIHSERLETDPVTDSERLAALATLLAKSAAAPRRETSGPEEPPQLSTKSQARNSKQTSNSKGEMVKT